MDIYFNNIITLSINETLDCYCFVDDDTGVFAIQSDVENSSIIFVLNTEESTIVLDSWAGEVHAMVIGFFSIIILFRHAGIADAWDFVLQIVSFN